MTYEKGIRELHGHNTLHRELTRRILLVWREERRRRKEENRVKLHNEDVVEFRIVD